MSKLKENIFIDAMSNFSQEEILSISIPEKSDPERENLYEIKYIPSQKIEKAAKYINSVLPIKFINKNEGKFSVGKYIVNIYISKLSTIKASCKCIDFAIRGRNEGSGCKHIAAVLNSYFPDNIKLLEV